MKLIQYIGDRNGRKIFVELNDTAYHCDGEFILFTKNEIYVNNDHSFTHKRMIDGPAQAGRYVVEEVDGVFIADECHRDSHPFHIPGYRLISNLSIGAIINIEGFQNPKFLSEKDKELLGSHKKVAKHIHEAYRKK